jgi:hypothetical protein
VKSIFLDPICGYPKAMEDKTDQNTKVNRGGSGVQISKSNVQSLELRGDLGVFILV